MFNFKIVNIPRPSVMVPAYPKTLVVYAEKKLNENRVALSPYGADVILRDHPEVTIAIQKGAGIRSDFPDEHYKSISPKVLLMEHVEPLVAFGDIHLKVKEPTLREIKTIGQFNRPCYFLDYVHAPADKNLAIEILKSPAVVFAHETVRKAGRTVLLDPMSELAGELSITEIAKKFFNVDSLTGKKVAVMGGLGSVGWSAVQTALSENADLVKIFELPSAINARYKKTNGSPKIHVYDKIFFDFDALKDVDIIVMAAYSYAGKPEVALTEELSRKLAALDKKILVIDVSIDQKGATFYTRKAERVQYPGDAPEPYLNNLYHSFIANLPSLAKKRATLALERATLPYIMKLIELGKKFPEDEMLRTGVNFAGGYSVLEKFEKELGFPYTPLDQINFVDWPY